MRIRDLAENTGVTRDTIRYFERSGLLDPPARGPSGHRVYDPTAAERIMLIRRLQNCGLTIDDIRQVLPLAARDGPESTRALVQLLRARLTFIDQRLAQLRACRERLEEAIAGCENLTSGAYPLLLNLPLSGISPPFRFGRGSQA